MAPTLPRSVLQVAAMCSMLIDHVGVIFFPEAGWMRVVGRLAFPLYAFFVAQGLIHTSNATRYLLRLFAWGLVSQIPYFVAFGYGRGNAIFTLFVGAYVVAMIIRPRLADGLAVGLLVMCPFIEYGAFGALLVVVCFGLSPLVRVHNDGFIPRVVWWGFYPCHLVALSALRLILSASPGA